MDNKDKQWLELLEKWHAGSFTRADEQALQRLVAGSDAFSREATEGYLDHPETDHKVHLNRILAQLDNQHKPAKRPWMLYSISIAAALALLITAVWWLNQAPDPITAPLLTDNSFPPSVPPATTLEPAPSTGGTDKAVTLRNIQGIPDPQLPSATNFVTTDSITNRAGTGATPVNPSADIAAEVTAPVVPGQVATSSAPAKVEEKDAMAYNDQSRQKENIQISPQSAQNAIKFEESNQVKAKKTMISPPIPNVGWDQFRKDMDTKLRLTAAAKENGIKSGTVNMILDIKPLDGKVRSVLFINKLGYGCDALAEQFVQQYIWQTFPGGSTQIEVEVEFRQ